MIDSFIRYVKFEKRYSDHTITAYEKDLKQLEAYASEELDKNTIQELTFKDVRAWIFFLSENDYTNKSINRKIATIKSYYKFLLSREIIQSNPADRIQPLKIEKKLPVFLREEEMTILLDQIVFEESTEFEARRNKVIFEMLYGTGIRLSELTGLLIKDVSFYSNSIKVLGKRNKERLIPMNTNLVKYIREYMEVRDELTKINDPEYFLLTNAGNKIYPVLIQRVVKKYIAEVSSVSKKSPHVLRHTFATHLLNKGADLNSVKDLLGHSSLAATQVYTHNTMSKLKAVFDQAHPKA
ncbi:MAG: tyrosine-type recombinase/integrase [Cyclobacteriaceae bacterium]